MRPKCVQNRLKPEAQIRFSLILLGFAGFMENTSRVRVPSRALKGTRKGYPNGYPFSCFRAPPGLEGSRSPLRFGRCRTNVPRTFCNVSRSLVQRLFSWFDSYDIYDENEKEKCSGNFWNSATEGKKSFYQNRSSVLSR